MFAPKPSSQRHFDHWAPQYDANVASYAYVVPQVVYAHVAPYIRSEGRLIDIGIGTGLCTEVIRRGYPALHITGVDVSPRMLAECEAKGTANKLHCLDIEHAPLPVPADSFDAAISGGMLEYIKEPANVFAQVHQALKAGGVFVFTFEPLATAAIYERQILSSVLERTSARITIERTKVASIPPFKYMRYLHDGAHIVKACEGSGFQILKTATFEAYHHSNTDVIAYGLVVTQKL